MGIRVQVCISPAVLPEKFIQVKSQIRGIVKPYVIPARFLHDRSRLLLFFRWEGLLHRNDLTRKPEELLRVFEMLRVFLHQVSGKVCKIFFAQTDDQKIAGNNIVQMALIIIKCPVQRQPHELTFIIADQPNQIIKGISCLNISANGCLQGFQPALNFSFIGRFARLYH